jgi:hypothetical protein
MKRTQSLRNEYYVYWPPWKGQRPIAWDPSDPGQSVIPECNYFGKVFEAMEKNLGNDDLTFYLTNSIYELPSYGQYVVAVVHADERSRIPTYSHMVRAVFKCYGTRPALGCNPFLKPSYLNFLALLEFIRTGVIRLPSLSNYMVLRLKSLLSETAEVPPIYDVPLGYFNQLDLPIKDIGARRYDVSFAGSVVHKSYPIWSPKHWLGTPKTLSRRRMVAALNTFSKEHPEYEVKLTITPSFSTAFNADARSYSEELMDSKICLVPRGVSLETFRFFEALRYGCIVVAEALPSRWFYDESPALQVEDWANLGGVLQDLIDDERLLQREHQRSLEWWRTKCSEAAVGAYIAGKLNP